MELNNGNVKYVVFQKCTFCSGNTEFGADLCCNVCMTSLCVSHCFGCQECGTLCCVNCIRHEENLNGSQSVCLDCFEKNDSYRERWLRELAKVYKDKHVKLKDLLLIEKLNGRYFHAIPEATTIRNECVQRTLTRLVLSGNNRAFENVQIEEEREMKRVIAQSFPSLNDLKDEEGKIGPFFVRLAEKQPFLANSIIFYAKDKLTPTALLKDWLKTDKGRDGIGALLYRRACFESGGDQTLCRDLLKIEFDWRYYMEQRSPRFPLHETKVPEMVQLFIRNGTDVEEKNFQGKTPLTFWLEHVRFDKQVVKALFESGATLNNAMEKRIRLSLNGLKVVLEYSPNFLNEEVERHLNLILPQPSVKKNVQILEYLSSIEYELPSKFVREACEISAQIMSDSNLFMTKSFVDSTKHRLYFCIAVYTHFPQLDVDFKNVHLAIERFGTKVKRHTISMFGAERKRKMFTFVVCLKKLNKNFGKDLTFMLLDYCFSYDVIN